MIKEEFQWIPFLNEMADKLLSFRNRRGELFALMKELAAEQPLMKYLHLDRDDWWGPRNHEIDPFTIIGIMNRKTTDTNRTALARILAKTFQLNTPVPVHFAGIPILNNRNSLFNGNDELWSLFEHALMIRNPGDISDEFTKSFDNAVAVKGNGVTYITMGLFWIRPDVFMPLDSNSKSYLTTNYGSDIPSVISGVNYRALLQSLKDSDKAEPPTPFYEISHAAWLGKNMEDQVTLDGNNYPLISSPKSNSPKIKGHSKNLILYGAPGTGKTYSSFQHAVAIIEEKSIGEVSAEDYKEVFRRYKEYKEEGLITFTTFHQSYSYEEFIEGIRPVLEPEEKEESGSQLLYEIHDGMFKSFCNSAGTPVRSGNDIDLGIGKNPTVWKVSLQGTGDNPTRTESMTNGHIRIGWDQYGEALSDSTIYTVGGETVLNAFYNKMKIGDLILSCYSSTHIDAIGVVTGEPEWHQEYDSYKRLRKVKWLVKGIHENIVDLNSGKNMTLSTVYRLSVTPSDAIELLRKVNPSLFSGSFKIPNRVFIIDEINRGNISKIFGELITLIEPSKRINAPEELRAILPYSGTSFGVPDNVYIIGTMNTADRSIALLDTALRRRFHFVEKLPDTEPLKDVMVDNIDIAELLNTLNHRLTILLDREHVVGHSYLLPLKENPSLENLAWIFEKQIIPLLQEYFFEDYEKIQLVLGDNQKPDDSTRFIVTRTDVNRLFGNAQIPVNEYFEINRDALLQIDAYAFL